MQLPPSQAQCSIPTKTMHLNHKLKQKNNTSLNKLSSFSSSLVIASKMQKHSKAIINKFQWFLEFICLKAKMLTNHVSEQSREEEGHVKIKVNPQDYEI
jgi:ribosome biogenesis protein Tsr3